MTAIKILVVDDEQSIRGLVSAYLRQEGYEVFEAADGASALKSVRIIHPDLIVLDIMLPGMDGLEVLTQIRHESEVYVILLTAKTEELDKIVGLSVGADDYITKPFSPRELVARVKAALRRIRAAGRVNAQASYEFNRLRMDVDSRKIWLDGAPLELTTTEFDLLITLAENRGRVLSREQLLENVWGTNFYGETRVIDVHIGNIRQKLGEDLIATIRGVGYRLDDEVVT
jgi:two-component system, OmpR family, alkaline phosphatase synthesis response regulator PhoP